MMTKPEEEPQTECPGANELPWRVSRASALKLNGTEILNSLFMHLLILL